eukprot:TRINITY_DN32794_c0_g1_i3.p1 TRINITY_DN32794_c0_g1~~TRINITY_DN32794_c0_g1_i3.p1  ORF type:complete len:3306 (+),score=813.23 TRINITY_DN32794_c0_g1_i3:143-10060(+)
MPPLERPFVAADAEEENRGGQSSHGEPIRVAFRGYDAQRHGCIDQKRVQALLQLATRPCLTDNELGRLEGLLERAAEKDSRAVSYERFVDWLYEPSLRMPRPPTPGRYPPGGQRGRKVAGGSLGGILPSGSWRVRPSTRYGSPRPAPVPVAEEEARRPLSEPCNDKLALQLKKQGDGVVEAAKNVAPPLVDHSSSSSSSGSAVKTTTPPLVEKKKVQSPGKSAAAKRAGSQRETARTVLEDVYSRTVSEPADVSAEEALRELQQLLPRRPGSAPRNATSTPKQSVPAGGGFVAAALETSPPKRRPCAQRTSAAGRAGVAHAAQALDADDAGAEQLEATATCLAAGIASELMETICHKIHLPHVSQTAREPSKDAKAEQLQRKRHSLAGCTPQDPLAGRAVEYATAEASSPSDHRQARGQQRDSKASPVGVAHAVQALEADEEGAAQLEATTTCVAAGIASELVETLAQRVHLPRVPHAAQPSKAAERAAEQQKGRESLETTSSAREHRQGEAAEGAAKASPSEGQPRTRGDCKPNRDGAVQALEAAEAGAEQLETTATCVAAGIASELMEAICRRVHLPRVPRVAQPSKARAADQKSRESIEKVPLQEPPQGEAAESALEAIPAAEAPCRQRDEMPGQATAIHSARLSETETASCVAASVAAAATKTLGREAALQSTLHAVQPSENMAMNHQSPERCKRKPSLGDAAQDASEASPSEEPQREQQEEKTRPGKGLLDARPSDAECAGAEERDESASCIAASVAGALTQALCQGRDLLWSARTVDQESQESCVNIAAVQPPAAQAAEESASLIAASGAEAAGTTLAEEAEEEEAALAGCVPAAAQPSEASAGSQQSQGRFDEIPPQGDAAEDAAEASPSEKLQSEQQEEKTRPGKGLLDARPSDAECAGAEERDETASCIAASVAEALTKALRQDRDPLLSARTLDHESQQSCANIAAVQPPETQAPEESASLIAASGAEVAGKTLAEEAEEEAALAGCAPPAAQPSEASARSQQSQGRFDEIPQQGDAVRDASEACRSEEEQSEQREEKTRQGAGLHEERPHSGAECAGADQRDETASCIAASVAEALTKALCQDRDPLLSARTLDQESQQSCVNIAAVQPPEAHAPVESASLLSTSGAEPAGKTLAEEEEEEEAGPPGGVLHVAQPSEASVMDQPDRGRIEESSPQGVQDASESPRPEEQQGEQRDETSSCIAASVAEALTKALCQDRNPLWSARTMDQESQESCVNIAAVQPLAAQPSEVSATLVAASAADPAGKTLAEEEAGLPAESALALPDSEKQPSEPGNGAEGQDIVLHHMQPAEAENTGAGQQKESASCMAASTAKEAAAMEILDQDADLPTVSQTAQPLENKAMGQPPDQQSQERCKETAPQEMSGSAMAAPASGEQPSEQPETQASQGIVLHHRQPMEAENSVAQQPEESSTAGRGADLPDVSQEMPQPLEGSEVMDEAPDQRSQERCEDAAPLDEPEEGALVASASGEQPSEQPDGGACQADIVLRRFHLSEAENAGDAQLDETTAYTAASVPTAATKLRDQDADLSAASDVVQPSEVTSVDQPLERQSQDRCEKIVPQPQGEKAESAVLAASSVFGEHRQVQQQPPSEQPAEGVRPHNVVADKTGSEQLEESATGAWMATSLTTTPLAAATESLAHADSALTASGFALGDQPSEEGGRSSSQDIVAHQVPPSGAKGTGAAQLDEIASCTASSVTTAAATRTFIQDSGLLDVLHAVQPSEAGPVDPALDQQSQEICQEETAAQRESAEGVLEPSERQRGQPSEQQEQRTSELPEEEEEDAAADQPEVTTPTSASVAADPMRCLGQEATLPGSDAEDKGGATEQQRDDSLRQPEVTEVMPKPISFLDEDGDTNMLVLSPQRQLLWCVARFGSFPVETLKIRRCKQQKAFTLRGPLGDATISAPPPGAGQKALLRQLLEMTSLCEVPMVYEDKEEAEAAAEPSRAEAFAEGTEEAAEEAAGKDALAVGESPEEEADEVAGKAADGDACDDAVAPGQSPTEKTSQVTAEAAEEVAGDDAAAAVAAGQSPEEPGEGFVEAPSSSSSPSPPPFTDYLRDHVRSLPPSAWNDVHACFAARSSPSPSPLCFTDYLRYHVRSLPASSWNQVHAAFAARSCPSPSPPPFPDYLRDHVRSLPASSWKQVHAGFASRAVGAYTACASILPVAEYSQDHLLSCGPAFLQQLHTAFARPDRDLYEGVSEQQLNRGLQAAVHYGLFEATRRLLKRGADPMQLRTLSPKLEVVTSSCVAAAEKHINEGGSLRFCAERYETSIVGVPSASIHYSDNTKGRFYFEVEVAAMKHRSAAAGILWAPGGSVQHQTIPSRLGPHGIEDFSPATIISPQLPVGAFLLGSGTWSIWRYAAEISAAVCVSSLDVGSYDSERVIAASIDFERQEAQFALHGLWATAPVLKLDASLVAGPWRSICPAALASQDTALTFSLEKAPLACPSGSLPALSAAGGELLPLLAARLGHWQIAKVLIENCAAALSIAEGRRLVRSRCTKHGRTLLHYACLAGDEDAAGCLLDLGAHRKLRDRAGALPMELAAFAGHADVLVVAGRGVEQQLCSPLAQFMASVLLRRQSSSLSPLQMRPQALGATLRAGAARGFEAVVRIILEMDADVDAAQPDGTTPLLLACKGGHNGVVNMLLAHGAAADAVSKSGRSPLYAACQHGQAETVDVLLQHVGARSETDRSQPGLTPIIAATRAGNADVVRRLLAGKADAGARISGGWSAVHLAAQGGHLDVLETLLKHDHWSLANAVTDAGWSALHTAAQNGDKMAACALLDHGASREASHGDGGAVPLHVAAQSGHEALVQLLVERRADVHAAMRNGATALHAACQHGHAAVARCLLRCDANPDLCMHGQIAPLHLAAQRGLSLLTQLLVDGKACVDLRMEGGYTPLVLAARGGHYASLHVLLSAGASCDVASDSGWTALLFACQAGDERIVQALAKSRADLERAAPKQRTPLIVACQGEHIGVVALLLEVGAKPDVAMANGWNALHIASKNGLGDIAEVLLRSGSDVDACTTSGWTALHIVAQDGNARIVAALLDARASLERRHEGGATALHVAVQRGQEAIMQLLLQGGAKVNETAAADATALHMACQHGSATAVALLLDHGADHSSIMQGGATALHIASKGGFEDVVRCLLRRNVDASAQISGGWSALMLAAHSGHSAVVQLLADQNANVNAQMTGGQTALHFACQHGHLDVVRSLLAAGADANPQPPTLAAQGGHKHSWKKHEVAPSPLRLARKNGHEAVAALLVQRVYPGVSPRGACHREGSS